MTVISGEGCPSRHASARTPEGSTEPPVPIATDPETGRPRQPIRLKFHASPPIPSQDSPGWASGGIVPRRFATPGPIPVLAFYLGAAHPRPETDFGAGRGTSRKTLIGTTVVSGMWLRTSLMAMLAMLLIGAPVSPAANPRVINLYSVWVELALRGHPQEEIESLLRNMDPETIEEVKERLRRTVISNLDLKKLGQLYRTSRDKDDLNVIVHSIQTELRFASLENDEEIRMMIQDRFGIPMSQF